MPALYNPLGFAQVKLIWTLTGDPEPMVVVFGVENVPTLTADEVANEVRSAWSTEVPAAQLSSAYTFRGCEAQLGTEVGEGGSVGVATVAVAGTGGLAPLPQNCALLAHKRTSLAGRKHRGRMFLPAGYLPEGAVSAVGVIDPANITGFGGLLTAFLANLATAPNELPMHVFHSDSGLPPTAVTTLVMDPVVATQRTRLRR